MGWYWMLYFDVAITTALCSLSKGVSLYSIRHIFFPLLVIVLVLFAGFRGYQVASDSSNYIVWFQEIIEIEGKEFLSLKDPAFYVVGKIVSSLGLGVSYLFLSFAAVALWSKFKLIRYEAYIKYSHYFIYLYFCRFYFAHEMTQIRVGAAVGLASLALILLYQKKIYLGIPVFILAIAFHLSVILMAPFFVLLILGYRFKSRLPLLVILCLAGLVNVYFDRLIDILGLQDFIRLSSYLSGAYNVQPISLVSVYFILKVFVFSYLIFFCWRSLGYLDRLVVSLVGASIFFQVALMNNDTLALRAAEVFSVFDLILFITPFLFLSARLRVFYSIFVFFIGGVFFISSLKIMGPYELVSF